MRCQTTVTGNAIRRTRQKVVQNGRDCQPLHRDRLHARPDGREPPPRRRNRGSPPNWRSGQYRRESPRPQRRDRQRESLPRRPIDRRGQHVRRMGGSGRKPRLMHSPAEVAAMLGVSARTLGEWRFTGAGPAFMKVGGVVRYPRDALTDWMQANQQTVA